jgi:hypothetical protein
MLLAKAATLTTSADMALMMGAQHIAPVIGVIGGAVALAEPIGALRLGGIGAGARGGRPHRAIAAASESASRPRGGCPRPRQLILSRAV